MFLLQNWLTFQSAHINRYGTIAEDEDNSRSGSKKTCIEENLIDKASGNNKISPTVAVEIATCFVIFFGRVSHSFPAAKVIHNFDKL